MNCTLNCSFIAAFVSMEFNFFSLLDIKGIQLIPQTSWLLRMVRRLMRAKKYRAWGGVGNAKKKKKTS